MKGFIKILILFGAMFFAYKYYLANYSEEAVKNKAKKDEEETKKQLKDLRKEAMDTCRNIYNNPYLSEGDKWLKYQQCERNVN